jgi:hypothetical protein
MDITNNVSISSPNQQGGNDEDNKEIESSDYDVSSDVVHSKKKKGGAVVLTEQDIVTILNGSEFNKDLENFNINDVYKNSYFNKLTNFQKTLVINRLVEKIPKNTKVPKQSDNVIKDCYFYCKNCGYNEKIPDKMFIFSRSNEKKSDDSNNKNFINNKFDNTLPFSKKYNCINKECETHKNPAIKKAVFYRLSNTYTIRYVCTICDHFWNTVGEV